MREHVHGKGRSVEPARGNPRGKKRKKKTHLRFSMSRTTSPRKCVIVPRVLPHEDLESKTRVFRVSTSVPQSDPNHVGSFSFEAEVGHPSVDQRPILVRDGRICGDVNRGPKPKSRTSPGAETQRRELLSHANRMPCQWLTAPTVLPPKHACISRTYHVSAKKTTYATSFFRWSAV